MHATDKNGSWTTGSRNVTWSVGWKMDSAIDSKDVLHVVASATNNTPDLYWMEQGTSVRHIAIDGSTWTETGLE